jgi:hypothetical protein
MLLNAVLYVSTTSAEPIYSQVLPANPTGAFSSDNVPDGQKVADNFVLNISEPVTIRSLRFIGGYGIKNPPPQTPPLDALPIDNFRVVFFADSGGAPGILLADGDFSVGVPIRRTPTGGPLLNGVETPLEYVVDLGTGISVGPSTIYWISILNNPGTNYSWAWARALGAFDQQTAGTFGNIEAAPWNVFTNGGMFFELSDRNVPEPSSIGILFAAICGMLPFFVRRRSSSCADLSKYPADFA